MAWCDYESIDAASSDKTNSDHNMFFCLRGVNGT